MDNSKRILIIDDDRSIVMYAKHILQKEGHIVHYCFTYNPEINFLDYDIAFVDLILPDIDGYTVIQQLLDCNPCIKIIAMSGGNIYPPSTYLPTALKCGAIIALYKPFNRNDIINCLKKVIDNV